MVFISILLKNLVFQLLVVLLLSIPGSFRKISFSSLCPCEDVEQCYLIKNVDGLKPHSKEVIVMSEDYNEPRKTWKSWHWPLISSVISVGDPDSTLMCHTHKEGRRYGFSGKLVPSLLSGSIDENPEFKSWLHKKNTLAQKNFVDIFMVNLLPVLSTDINNTTMELVFNTTKIIKKSFIHNISLVCLIPWKPPCYESKCNFATRMNSLCEFFMLSADSFLLSSNGEKCLARATVPFPHLHLGFDEYMMSQLPSDKFILSIPWHGYAYHCSEFIPSNNKTEYDQCFVHEKNGSCDFEHCRQKVDMNELTTTYDDHFTDETKHVYHKRYMAPYFITKNETSNETTQIWYEDISSLHEKYIYVQQMKMGGVALWSGNDLHYASNTWFTGFSNAMWAWVLHGIYLQSDKPQPNFSHLVDLPKKMAGIGIGCVFVGGFLGFIFGWGVFQRTSRKNRRQPFEKDMDYMEEDQNL